MNFTRDPIIESVISPKEGFKLLVRPSARDSEEEYTVDALEIVSFGSSHFFRSLEKPKAFLLPAGDYEVVEVKETRVVLKKATIDKPIKIAGGKKASKETSQDKPREKQQEQKQETTSPKAQEAEQEKPAENEGKSEAKKGRRKKRGKETKKRQPAEEETKKEEAEKPPERKMRTLLPPPNSLISDSISKYKDSEAYEGSTTGSVLDETVPSGDDAVADSNLNSVSVQEEKQSSQKAEQLQRSEEETPPQETAPTEEQKLPHGEDNGIVGDVSPEDAQMFSSEHVHPEYEEGWHSKRGK